MKTLSDKEIRKGAERFYAARHIREFIKEILESPLKEVFQIKALIKNRAGDALVLEDER